LRNTERLRLEFHRGLVIFSEAEVGISAEADERVVAGTDPKIMLTFNVVEAGLGGAAEADL
jgi:hypothetical protein